MSFSRIGLGLFKGIGGGVSGAIGASLITLAARSISTLSPINFTEAAYVLALGNFIYGLAVSDANGDDKVQRAMGINSFATTAAMAVSTRASATMFYAANNDIDNALKSYKGGAIREQFFIQDFLYSTFENVTAGTIGFGILMLLNPSTIPYLQLMESTVAGTLVASTVRSAFY